MSISEETKMLKKELEDAGKRLEAARSNFNYAESEEMVDYYTYLIIANEKLYGYLSRKYKEICESERVVPDGIS